MRAVRLVLGCASLAVAAAAVTLGVLPSRWPAAPFLAALAAVALGLAALLVPVGRHRGRTGAHARPGALAEARAAAADNEARRAETAAVRAVIAPGRPPDPAPPRPAPPGVLAAAGRLPAVPVPVITGRPVVMPDLANGRRRAAAAWGSPAGCPDPDRCGASPRCPGTPGCLDPAPVNAYGRVMLAAGRIPVYAAGRHEQAEEEVPDDDE